MWKLNFFGGKRVVVFGRCDVTAICCVVWKKRNRRTFDDLRRGEVVDLCERVRFVINMIQSRSECLFAWFV